MSPVTHLLASWTLADATIEERRDLALVAFAGLVPDADGLGVVADLANRALGRPDTWIYGAYHHALLHGLPGALAISVLAAAFARRRLRTAALAFAAAHLHLLADLVGSRGPTADDLWPIRYLAPLSDAGTFAWSGQWALNAWPNVAITIVLVAWALARGVTEGRTPVGLFSAKADAAVVATLRRRFAQNRSPSTR